MTDIDLLAEPLTDSETEKVSPGGEQREGLRGGGEGRGYGSFKNWGAQRHSLLNGKKVTKNIYCIVSIIIAGSGYMLLNWLGIR